MVQRLQTEGRVQAAIQKLLGGVVQELVFNSFKDASVESDSMIRRSFSCKIPPPIHAPASIFNFEARAFSALGLTSRCALGLQQKLWSSHA